MENVQTDTSPQTFEQTSTIEPTPPTVKKPILIAATIIAISIIIPTLIYFLVKTPPNNIQESPATQAQVTSDTPTPTAPEPYQNPFDTSENYVNPFDEYKNPFEVLQ